MVCWERMAPAKAPRCARSPVWCGRHPARSRFSGRNITSLAAYEIAALGIAHVPEGRQVFPELTVRENLEVGAYVAYAKAARSHTLDLVFTIFPILAERRKQLAGTMSGGEQQMLAWPAA